MRTNNLVARQGGCTWDTGPLLTGPVSRASAQCKVSLSGLTIQLGVPQHAHKQVGVAQPGGCILQALNCPEDDLSIQIVWDGGHKLALNGQLHVEQGQVELQLLVACNGNRILGSKVCSASVSRLTSSGSSKS